eukprot:360328-Chlamydomonas_euryale.AAC.14
MHETFQIRYKRCGSLAVCVCVHACMRRCERLLARTGAGGRAPRRLELWFSSKRCAPSSEPCWAPSCLLPCLRNATAIQSTRTAWTARQSVAVAAAAGTDSVACLFSLPAPGHASLPIPVAGPDPARAGTHSNAFR